MLPTFQGANDALEAVRSVVRQEGQFASAQVAGAIGRDPEADFVIGPEHGTRLHVVQRKRLSISIRMRGEKESGITKYKECKSSKITTHQEEAFSAILVRDSSILSGQRFRRNEPVCHLTRLSWHGMAWHGMAWHGMAWQSREAL